MENNKINVVVMDSSNIFREGIKLILNSDRLIHVKATGNGNKNISEMLQTHEPNVLIVGKAIFDRNKTDIENEILKDYPQTKIAINIHDSFVMKALKIGIHGYLLRDMSEDSFIEAVKMIHVGLYYIHPKLSHFLVDEYLNNEVNN
ncbi:response regulator transcription factor [Pseudogracilibacillus auburnensis]|uniref:response regulator transcription factor n=1 Tax=Pseudogracilibacillus auburnensis TaxID=1494959 RepID=UPI001A961F88|nr:response regulator transcription factor [Pseudogracilibacillus auburnensis]MBO1002356.1 response regulator transcription factor [Pseudogracilibacillus auburnensis]